LVFPFRLEAEELEWERLREAAFDAEEELDDEENSSSD